jgi:hypothetical protein
MSDVNFNDFPVFFNGEFEKIIADVHQDNNGKYWLHLNFFKNFASDGELNAQGMTWATNISAFTLKELFHRLDMLNSIGLFHGTDLSSHGSIFDEDFEEIGDICWFHEGGKIDHDEDEEDDTTPTVTVTQSELVH